MSELADIRARLLETNEQFAIEECEIGGVRTRIWKKAPASLREVIQASAQFAERTYLVYEDESLSYAAHYARTVALAHVLQTRFALAKGERVAIAMRNYPEYATIFWAVIAVGAVVVPLNAWGTKNELEFALIDSGAKLLFADEARLLILAASALELTSVVVRGQAKGACQFEELFGANRANTNLPECDIQPEDAATLMYTSGTTGVPKGALTTHRAITSTIWTTLFGLASFRLSSGEQADTPNQRKVFLLTSPLFHVIGLFSALVVQTYLGSKLVLMHKWDASEALSLVEREGVTTITTVPTIMRHFTELAATSARDLTSLERLTIGGAPTPPDLVTRMREVFPGVTLGTGWGMTETASPATHCLGEVFEQRVTSVGLVTPVCETRIVDPGGTDVARGDIGELWIRGPNVIRGYWQNTGATRQGFAAGWLRTGDLVREDDDEFLYIVDRSKDMIIRGGENIYCVEVENACLSCAGVNDAAVFGLPDEEFGEVPVAVVQVQAGTTLDAATLRSHLQERLARFKIPVRFAIRDDALPCNAAGKVLKQVLRQQLLAAVGKNTRDSM